MTRAANENLTGMMPRVNRKSVWALLRAAWWTVLHPVVRHHRRLIWEADLAMERPRSCWDDGERLLNLGPENVDAELTPGLRRFLAAADATSELEGVRAGDRLFVLANDRDYLASSYIFFNTTKETRRQARILGEGWNTPIIGLSYTAPASRGRGIYRRLLNEMFRFLSGLGYARAVCEVDPL